MIYHEFDVLTGNFNKGYYFIYIHVFNVMHMI